MTPTQIIAMLNALTCGDLDALTARLEQARRACAGLGQPELARLVDEARQSLLAGDLKAYRKRIETAVARLGHLRARPETAAGTAGNPAAG